MPLRRHALAAALALFAAPVAHAQGNEPPAALPPNTSFPSSAVHFGEAALGFSTAGISIGSAAVAAGSAPVAAGLTEANVREEAGGALRFTLNADVLFDFDKANLKPEADAILRRLAEQIQARVPHGRARYRVEGHTDGKGTDAYNNGLSQRRARSVQAWLTHRAGVPGRLVATAGFGKRQPVAPNVKPDGSDDPEGRRLNRRVEIVVVPGA